MRRSCHGAGTGGAYVRCAAANALVWRHFARTSGRPAKARLLRARLHLAPERSPRNARVAKDLLGALLALDRSRVKGEDLAPHECHRSATIPLGTIARV